MAATLTQWLERIQTGPHALAELRGRHQWAYISKVDGTGQPFQLSIPNDYDPQQTWPLLIFLHGRGMTHRGNKYVPNTHLLLHPLGRSRAGRYTALSEVDVLEGMAYVRRHWNIDPDRIHIKGGSMGGGGTFITATRHPDLAVTAEDMAKYKLLLLGDARQNPVVARIADRLPLKIDKGRVSTSDGVSWAFDDRALCLLHFNPLAPNRLIYWVASDTPDFYRAGTPLMSIGRSAAGPDFILMHATQWQTVAARRFESRWNWELGYGQSSLVGEQCATPAGTTAASARALRLATGADFALAGPDFNAAETFLAVGETRRMVVTARAYDQRIVVVELTGRQLMAAPQLAEKRDNRNGYYRVLPEPQAPAINPVRQYRVAVIPKVLGAYVRLTRTNPLNVRLTDQHVKEALARFWPIQEEER